MTRGSTLLLALLIMNVLMGTLCLVVARGERRSAALRLWGWGLLVYAAGILITIPAQLPLGPRKIVGNALIAYSPILAVAGALSHTSHRLNRAWVTAGFAASVAPIVYNHLAGHSLVLVDLLSPAPIANVLFLIAAVDLARDPPPDARAAGRFLSAIFVFCVLVWTVRLTVIGFQIGGTNDRERGDLAIALFSIAQIVIAVSATLGLLWIEVRKMEAVLRRIAESDALTGLPNRRATLARFRDEAARSARERHGFGMLVLDIDHFKHINDGHGHLAGDAVLRHVAGVLRSTLRASEAVGRIGGEEFVVLLAHQERQGAIAAANRLRESVAASAAGFDSRQIAVTLSGGLAMYPEDGADWDALFAVADRRLYEAKRAGRNRVEGL